MSQLVSAAKFGILAAIAFLGPKIITESGNYLARVERHDESEAADAPRARPSANALSEVPRFDASTPSGTGFRAEKYSARYGGALFETANWPTSSDAGENRPESPMTPLTTAIRFDRTPRWIVSTWPRVRTDDSVEGRRGYRVPLLTGTESDDLSGALTYYFDQQGLCRISFVGWTGDFRKLLAFLEYRFGMTLDDDSTPAEYRYHSTLEERPKATGDVSHLTIRGATVFDAAAASRRFDITFDLFAP